VNLFKKIPYTIIIPKGSSERG